MGKREESAEAPALPRLPPGRHGLSREFVTQNQRERLAAGIIAAVADHGYHGTTISTISAAAGVSRRTFYAYFSSKEECYLDTYDLIAAHLTEAAREAAAGKGEWSEKVIARLRAALEAFQANPDLATYVLIAPARAGEEPLERYQRGLEEALQELCDGMPAEVEPPSEGTQLALVNGIFSLVARSVEDGGGDELVAMLPDLSQIFLTPYMGQTEALAAARRA